VLKPRGVNDEGKLKNVNIVVNVSELKVCTIRYLLY
jgi:hypothetical protein